MELILKIEDCIYIYNLFIYRAYHRLVSHEKYETNRCFGTALDYIMCLLDINEIGSTHIIVCTNGYPNYGVGGINDDNIEEMKLYYNKLSQTLTSRRVSMDIYASGGNTIQVPVLYVYI